MTVEEFKEICSSYFGTFSRTERNEIMFCSKNEIISYYQDGTIHTQKKVDCEIALRNRGYLSACEKTYAILGGCSYCEGTADILKMLLTRYNFKPKAQQDQMTIFDLIKAKEEL
jgi:hypothetical protein